MDRNRHIDQQLQEHFSRYREILILLGSRQTGKTTIVKKIFPDAIYLLADNEPVRKLLETYDAKAYKSLIAREPATLIIDEIHQLSDPGRAAKILYDELSYKLVLTGSSSFHIKNKTTESLAGRKIDYFLYPLTMSEYLHQNGLEKDEKPWPDPWLNDAGPPPGNVHRLYDFKIQLRQVLLFGLYPGMLNHPSDQKYLLNFVDSLVYKDIMEFGVIENRRIASDLLKLLAYQVGDMINYSELSDKLQVDQRTIKRYIDIFEQSFIIFRLHPFLGNKRDQIVKSPKIYFFDTGIRNAIINDFSEPDLRPDLGRLFENFIISDFLKYNMYFNRGFVMNYWRTKQGSEIDLVLSRGDELFAFEIKYGKGAINKAFLNRHPHAQMRMITAENFF